MNAQKPQDQYQRRKAVTRQLLRDAFARLRAGKPRSPALQVRGVKLNVTTLAKEAGISRNAIYTNHAEILDELRELSGALGAKDETSSTKGELGQLKQALRQAEEKQRQLATYCAELLARSLQAERELKELRVHHHRLNEASQQANSHREPT